MYLFVTPYELAFVAHVKKTSALYACNMFVDVCFWCDVLFQFNTGYYHADQGRWITDRKGISMRYLKLWFWLDMASLLTLWFDGPTGRRFYPEINKIDPLI